MSTHLLSLLLSLQCFASCWGLICAEKQEQKSAIRPSRVTIRIVSVNDKILDEGANPLPAVQVDSKGVFAGSSGSLVLGKQLGFLFQKGLQQGSAEDPIIVSVHLMDEKNMPISALIDGIDTLRQAVPSDVHAVIFVRIQNLKGIDRKDK